MTSITEIIKFISKYDFFYVLGHERPDGDCIGSQLAMSGLLTELKKKHIVLSAGPFTDSISRSYQTKFVSNLDDLPYAPSKKDNAALIFLDASTPSRMGAVFNSIYHMPTVVIDHHASGDENYGNVRYIDTSAPSNTILVYRLFKAYKIVPNIENAYYILLGILTDTQFFRFVKKNDSEPFVIASELIKLGVTPGDVYKQISYGYTFLSRKVIAKVIERAHRLNNNRIILTYIKYNDYTHVDDIPQSYEIYQMLEGTHTTEIVVYIQEVLDEHNQVISKVGMRSKKYDVGSIAQQWGGGGHTNASGFSIPKPLEETTKILIDYFDSIRL